MSHIHNYYYCYLSVILVCDILPVTLSSSALTVLTLAVKAEALALQHLHSLPAAQSCEARRFKAATRVRASQLGRSGQIRVSAKGGDTARRLGEIDVDVARGPARVRQQRDAWPQQHADGHRLRLPWTGRRRIENIVVSLQHSVCVPKRRAVLAQSMRKVCKRTSEFLLVLAEGSGRVARREECNVLCRRRIVA